MGLFSTVKAESLEDILMHNLKDLYDAEHRILDALEKLIQKASYPALAQSLEHHRQETEEQVARLEKCFSLMDAAPERQACDGMKGVLAEGEKMLKEAKEPELKDVSIIEGCQKVEHYEIAAYGTAKAIAMELGKTEIADLLDQTLQEEMKADETLSDIAMKDVNPKAK